MVNAQAQGKSRLKGKTKLNSYLIRRVGHVGFGGLTQSFHLSHFIQLHVEEIEDEAIERWSQAITQPPNSSDHPLHHTWGKTRERKIFLQLLVLLEDASVPEDRLKHPGLDGHGPHRGSSERVMSFAHPVFGWRIKCAWAHQALELKAAKSKASGLNHEAGECLSSRLLVYLREHSLPKHQHNSEQDIPQLGQAPVHPSTTNSNTVSAGSCWDELTLLVRVRVPRHHGADGWKGDAGHGSHGSCSPHHPGGQRQW